MNKVRTKKAHCRQEKKLLLKRVHRQQHTLEQASETIFSSISQNLCLAKLNLATSGVEQPPAALEKIQDSHQLVSRAIIDLRQLGNELHEAIA